MGSVLGIALRSEGFEGWNWTEGHEGPVVMKVDWVTLENFGEFVGFFWGSPSNQLENMLKPRQKSSAPRSVCEKRGGQCLFPHTDTRWAHLDWGGFRYQ